MGEIDCIYFRVKMKEKLKQIICDTIDSKKVELNNISQEILKNPELNFKEFKAHALLTSYLEKKGFEVAKSTPLETSFIARYGKKEGTRSPLGVKAQRKVTC
eukprot:TCONS_00042861-protein